MFNCKQDYRDKEEEEKEEEADFLAPAAEPVVCEFVDVSCMNFWNQSRYKRLE